MISSFQHSVCFNFPILCSLLEQTSSGVKPRKKITTFLVCALYIGLLCLTDLMFALYFQGVHFPYFRASTLLKRISGERGALNNVYILFVETATFRYAYLINITFS